MKKIWTPLRRIAVLLTFIAFIFSSVLMAQAPAAPTSLLWKVSGKGLKQPSYLYGTYHLVPSGYLPADGKVLQAFQASKGVIVEIDADSTAMQQAGMQAFMPNNKLSELIAAQDYGLVSDELKATIGYDLKLFEQVKPITVSLMLSVTYGQEAAPWLKDYQGLPLDAYFVAEGKRTRKNILALESVEEQMQLLYQNETLEKQASDLVKIVREKDAMRQLSADIINNWKSENIDQMAAVSVAMMDEFGGQDDLLDNRNMRWMDILPKQFKKGSQFMAVGALHLVGDKGIINLLREKGYTVEPVIGK